MRRKIIAALLALTLLFGVVPTGLAHLTPVHNKQIEYVLFPRDGYRTLLNNDQKDALDALEKAVAICLDQFNGHDENLLSDLKQYGIPNLPSSIAEIDFKGGIDSHRQYTHKGWEPTTIPELGNWPKRKEILLDTVNFVFNFGFGTDIYIAGRPIRNYADQCDAFAALLFYIHLIGDTEYTKTYNNYLGQKDYIIPLVSKDVSSEELNILSELLDKTLPRVFVNCQKDHDYKALIRKLNREAKRARKDARNIEKNYEKYHKHAKNVLEIMHRYIPNLLKKEKFFTDVFGTDR